MASKVDYSKLIASVNKMRELPSKHGPDVLNRTSLKVAIGSKGSKGLIQLTEKATKAGIEADLKRDKLGIKLAMKWIRREGKKPTRLLVSQYYKRIRDYRVRGKGYLAAGWMFAGAKLAAKIPGAKLTRLSSAAVEKFESGTAQKSYDKSATAASLSSGLFNASEGVEKVVGVDTIQKAVDAALQDNLVYLQRKFGAGVKDAIMGTNSAAAVQEPS